MCTSQCATPSTPSLTTELIMCLHSKGRSATIKEADGDLLWVDAPYVLTATRYDDTPNTVNILGTDKGRYKSEGSKYKGADLIALWNVIRWGIRTADSQQFSGNCGNFCGGATRSIPVKRNRANEIVHAAQTEGIVVLVGKGLQEKGCIYFTCFTQQLQFWKMWTAISRHDWSFLPT